MLCMSADLLQIFFNGAGCRKLVSHPEIPGVNLATNKFTRGQGSTRMRQAEIVSCNAI